MRTLFARLSFAFFGILLLLGLLVLWITHRSSEQYLLEFTQQLNTPIAMYMAQNGAMDTGDLDNTEWLADLAPHVMMINPSVEVYLLDKTGRIVGSSPDNTDHALSSVNVQPIEAFLDPDRVLPILGDDPKHNSRQRIFSAYPVYTNLDQHNGSTLSGYLYVVLAGEQHQSILASISSSYSFKNLVLTICGVLLLALLSGLLVFLMLTRRLRQLSHEVAGRAMDMQALELKQTHERSGWRKLDEIDHLAQTFHSMADQLVKQYAELEAQDENRRAFIANISHDLRTPLTTMQSYLETLLLKDQSLSAEDTREYIRIAYRKSKQLRKLVAQLFTLARLEAGEYQPSFETFSLLELAHDTAQEFQIRAASRGIQLVVNPEDNQGIAYDVMADIGLIHRVFENLVGNAIRHTPDNGRVLIRITRQNRDNIDIAIIDNGCGMSKQQCEQTAQHTGLGLAIVRNLLALHDSELHLDSERKIGTTVAFKLPAAEQNADLGPSSINKAFVRA